MSCPLLSDQLLLTCLSQNLVELHLTLYSDDQSQLNFDMDRLSGMSKLQQMHINSICQTRTWTTQGLLSSLTALEGFTFLGDSMMVGPLMTALGSLPKLTALTTSHIPGDRIEPYSTHFTALKRLVMKYSERDASVLHIAVGPSLSSLCKLSLSNCHVVSTPVPFKYLSSLTKVSFDGCEFVLDESVWLSEALEGATQIQSLAVDSTLTHDIPNSVCQMVGLKQLRMQYTLLSDLPPEFAQLRHLEDLDLPYNKLSGLPTILEQMTHLRNINLRFASDTMQLTRPMTFLSAFANLESLCLSSPPTAWSSVSSFHTAWSSVASSRLYSKRLSSIVCLKPSLIFHIACRLQLVTFATVLDIMS